MRHREPVERTFAIIKPDAVEGRHVGEVLSLVELEGFVIRTVVLARPSYAAWEAFYGEHAGKDFFGPLCAFMASGPSVLLVLEAERAVARWREVMGATDPRAARAGTVRHRYGDKTGVVYRNAVHGSDSVAAADREQAFFFDPGGPGQARSLSVEQAAAEVDRLLPQLPDGVAARLKCDYGEVVRLLRERAGERGESEGLLDVLRRVLRESKEAPPR